MIPVRIFTKTLLLISLVLSFLIASAQNEPMLTRNQEGQSRFGVPVVTEERGDGWLNIYYVVKPGNTLYSISRQFGLSVPDVRKINEMATDVIYVGQRLLMMREELPFAQAERPVGHTQVALPRPADTPAPVPVQPAPAEKILPAAPAVDLIIIDNFEEASDKPVKKEPGQ